jgi:Protein of unknown function (DUF4056)
MGHGFRLRQGAQTESLSLRAIWFVILTAGLLGCHRESWDVGENVRASDSDVAAALGDTSQENSPGLAASDIPEIPYPQALRPCCAFGADLKVALGRVPVPGVEIGNLLGPSDLGPHRYDTATSPSSGPIRAASSTTRTTVSFTPAAAASSTSPTCATTPTTRWRLQPPSAVPSRRHDRSPAAGRHDASPHPPGPDRVDREVWPHAARRGPGRVAGLSALDLARNRDLQIGARLSGAIILGKGARAVLDSNQRPSAFVGVQGAGFGVRATVPKTIGYDATRFAAR